VYGDLFWIGWLYSDPRGVDLVSNDWNAKVTIFGASKERLPGVDYSEANYPFGPMYSDVDWEGKKQWFRVVSWPFVMTGTGYPSPMYAVGWLWTTPYKVKRFMVGRSNYKIYYADGTEIGFMQAIHH